MLVEPAAAFIPKRVSAPYFSTVGLDITISPGVSIAGTVSLFPLPGTIRPATGSDTMGSLPPVLPSYLGSGTLPPLENPNISPLMGAPVIPPKSLISSA